ncbi:hypothetical protein [Streptomyces coeruleorubidus]|uniref:hypothetical protein n=1 Tax=Streptomyces coeruleorubidus TaxID=116188 RepID=UPI0033F8EED0
MDGDRPAGWPVEDEAAEPELCDWCGAVIEDGSELYAIVWDSSVVHAHDPRYDGARMVVGCAREHLQLVQEQYRQRPFVDAELWAGKIERVLDKHPEGISQEELCRLTGLNPAQIELGVLWQDVHFLLSPAIRPARRRRGPGLTA